MKSRWNSIWAGSTPAAKSRVAHRFPCNRRGRARKDFVSSRRPPCPAPGAVCTATQCGCCPSTPTNPRRSYLDSSLGRMRSENRRRGIPTAPAVGQDCILRPICNRPACLSCRHCVPLFAPMPPCGAANPAPHSPPRTASPRSNRLPFDHPCRPIAATARHPRPSPNRESGIPGRPRLRSPRAKPGNASVPDRRRGRRKRAQ